MFITIFFIYIMNIIVTCQGKRDKLKMELLDNSETRELFSVSYFHMKGRNKTKGFRSLKLRNGTDFRQI